MNIDGDELEYIEQGTGEPLVLVHGSASDYRTWHLQQAAFSKHFRTITYSRRYHWPNQPIPDGGDYYHKILIWYKIVAAPESTCYIEGATFLRDLHR